MKQILSLIIVPVFILTLSNLAIAADDCSPIGGLNFVCGPSGVEDLVQVPGTHWIVGSGMAERGNPGKLHLIDANKKSWEILYPGANPKNELDAKT